MARDNRLLADLLRYFDGDDEIRFDGWDAEAIQHHLLLLIDDGYVEHERIGHVLKGYRPIRSSVVEVGLLRFRTSYPQFRVTNSGHDLLDRIAAQANGASPPPDGPGERGAVWWQGRCVTIPTKAWELLMLVWGSDRVPFLELCSGENHVTGWSDATPETTIRSAVRALNGHLERHGIPVIFETAGETVFRSA